MTNQRDPRGLIFENHILSVLVIALLLIIFAQSGGFAFFFGTLFKAVTP